VSAKARHEVVDVRMEEGELSFEARIGGRSERIWLRTETPVEPNADAVLPVCLMPAMKFGGSLAVPAPISPRLLRTQREFVAIQRAWSREWEHDDALLHEVELTAPARQPKGAPAAAGGERVAAFFSGGVDSWSTVLDNPEITALIFVVGFDLRPWEDHHTELIGTVEARLREMAEELGRPLHVVETNLRRLADPLLAWDTYYASALAAVALFLAPLFQRILIAGDSDYEVQVAMGAGRLIDTLWSTERTEIFGDGGRFSRVERLQRIAGNPLVQRSLRVCWENPGGAYNCGRCRKCLLTAIPLEALGARAEIDTFPAELDLTGVEAIEVNRVVSLTLWEDVLDVVRAAGREDLEPAVETVVENGKRILGLPPDYRRRRTPGPPPLREREPVAPDAAAEGQDEAAAETLGAVLGSRSWRMTAPLRRLGAAVRRLGAAVRRLPARGR